MLLVQLSCTCSLQAHVAAHIPPDVWARIDWNAYIHQCNIVPREQIEKEAWEKAEARKAELQAEARAAAAEAERYQREAAAKAGAPFLPPVF